MDQNSGCRHTGHQFDPAQAFTSCWHTGQRAGNEISRKFRNIRIGIFALVAVVGAFNKEKALVGSFSKYEIMWKPQRNFVDNSKRERERDIWDDCLVKTCQLSAITVCSGQAASTGGLAAAAVLTTAWPQLGTSRQF